MTLLSDIRMYSETVSKLRNRMVLTYFESPTKVFYRFRINPDEKRVFWMKEASLDRRNWIAQNHFLGIKDVIFEIIKIRRNNQLNEL